MGIFNYRHSILYYVLHHLRTSLINQIRCALTRHEISENDEEELFLSPQKFIRTKCRRCNYPLLLRIDPTDKEENTYMVVEL